MKYYKIQDLLIAQMTENYEKLEKLGEGTYGVVYKVRHKKTGRLLALKKIRLESEQEGIPATTIREISLLKSLKHPTIIELIDVSYSEDKLFMIFEYVEMDLRQMLDNFFNNEKLLSLKIVNKISYQILTAVNLCHSRGILHRDIKPQNILISKDFDIKLADFGLGRSINIPLRTYSVDIITLWYRGPELLLGGKYYSWSVDMWSVGCIFAELVLYRPLFPGDSEIDQLYKIFAVLGTPNEKIWPNCDLFPKFKPDFPDFHPESLYEILPTSEIYVDMIYRLLVYNPIQRLTAKAALEHPFFNT